eukprot:535143-Rhodomonas_salina.2
MFVMARAKKGLLSAYADATRSPVLTQHTMIPDKTPMDRFKTEIAPSRALERLRTGVQSSPRALMFVKLVVMPRRTKMDVNEGNDDDDRRH